jgi:hypothetical protein
MPWLLVLFGLAGGQMFNFDKRDLVILAVASAWPVSLAFGSRSRSWGISRPKIRMTP